MLDIDFFKQYNDSYGHVGGDECLKLVADLLSIGCSRAQDLVARYGGEEFVMVLPQTDIAAAALMAEKCRTAVLDAKIPREKSGIGPYLTVSQGVGTIVPTEQDSPLAFIEAVDKSLYRAKLQGRNCVALPA